MREECIFSQVFYTLVNRTLTVHLSKTNSVIGAHTYVHVAVYGGSENIAPVYPHAPQCFRSDFLPGGPMPSREHTNHTPRMRNMSLGHVLKRVL